MPNLAIGFRIPLVVFLTTVSVTAVIGNGLVILAWIFYAPVRKPQNIYLVSLASADILVGGFLVPSMLGELGSGSWPFGRLWCEIYMLMAWLVSTVSILHLIAISLDRYHIIFDTFTYMRRRTVWFFLRRILLIWTFAVWLIVPPMRDWTAIGDRSQRVGLCITNMSAELSVHMAFGTYFLPMLLIASTYIAIYKKLKRRRKRLESMQCFLQPTTPTNASICVGQMERGSSGTSERGRSQTLGIDLLGKSLRATKMLGAIIGAFTISWLPFTVGYSIIGFLPEESRPPPVLLPIIVAIGYSNSAMNPIIYAFCNPDFRQGFKIVLLFWKKCH